MNIVIVGGSSTHLGGVETFCDRAVSALEQHVSREEIVRVRTETAYMTTRSLPRIVAGLGALVRQRVKRRAIIWLHYVNLPDLCYLLVAKTLGFRVMVTPHLGANWRSQQNPVLRRLSQSILSLADRMALIAVTQAREIALPADVPQTMITTFLPAEVLAPVDSDKAADAPLRLIHASRLSEAKGSFLFIDVCARLREAGIFFAAQIIGGADQATYARLRGAIAAAGLGDHVELIEWVPPAELIAHLRRADVLVHLSRIDSYPLIVLEALACGVFPLVLDLAGARHMVESYDGAIVDADGAVEQAAEMLIGSDVADIRQRGSRQAQRVRADFAWDRAGAHLADALADTGGRAVAAMA